MIRAARKRVRKNPKRSLRQIVKDMKVSVTSIRTIKNDLLVSSYKRRKRQYLTPIQKLKRLERASFFLGELKADTAQRERSFFKMKNSSLLKRLLKIIPTEVKSTLQQTLMTP